MKTTVQRGIICRIIKDYLFAAQVHSDIFTFETTVLTARIPSVIEWAIIANSLEILPVII